MYHAYRLQVIADRHFLIPHTICGFIALLAGPLQFSSKLRSRYLECHRVLGLMYLISVFIGACTGVALAAGRPGLPGTSMPLHTARCAPAAYLADVPAPYFQARLRSALLLQMRLAEFAADGLKTHSRVLYCRFASRSGPAGCA
jgi:hypothetical protein